MIENSCKGYRELYIVLDNNFCSGLDTRTADAVKKKKTSLKMLCYMESKGLFSSQFVTDLTDILYQVI